MSTLQLTLAGYVRKYACTSFVPDELTQLILNYHPKLMTFNLFDSNNFICSKNGTYIQGRGNTCNAYFVYIGYSTFMTDGFDEGVHCLSILNKNHEGSGQCIHSLGIISERNEKWTNDKRHVYNAFVSGSNETYSHCFEGFPNYWTNGQILTLKLDLNAYEITYYLDWHIVQKQAIHKGLTYFFGAHLCASDDIKMEIVETPKLYDKQHKSTNWI